MTTPVERPAESAGGLYFKTPVTPEEAFQAIGRLRKEARDEIDRLIRFLDKTDDYVSRELEDSIDDIPHDDDELDGPEHEDNEPCLGTIEAKLDIGDGYARTQFFDQSKTQGNRDDCEGDEHDGRERDSEDEGAQCDDEGVSDDREPSLGWGIDGERGNLSGADRELQDHAPVKPQHRTGLGRGIDAAPNYCFGHRVLGLSLDQETRFVGRLDPVRQ